MITPTKRATQLREVKEKLIERLNTYLKLEHNYSGVILDTVKSICMIDQSIQAEHDLQGYREENDHG